jgi:hypothetical protein
MLKIVLTFFGIPNKIFWVKAGLVSELIWLQHTNTFNGWLKLLGKTNRE